MQDYSLGAAAVIWFEWLLSLTQGLAMEQKSEKQEKRGQVRLKGDLEDIS